MTVNRHTCQRFLRNWLNRFSRFWYQVTAMTKTQVNYGLVFALDPRGASPSSFTKLQNSSDIYRDEFEREI